MPMWADICVAVLLIVGALAALIGTWGMLRLPDFMTRLHAPTKAATLGAGCALAALALRFYFVEGGSSLRYLIPLGFVFVTAPVSAHMLARAWRARHPVTPKPDPAMPSASP
ncbi:monovalent cation/H(+) antiporter subunit G [Niveibacterium sp. 24ML]|uniref:monovalent cation/H(+) antiporter subunit G n=1 Tax=Niveibacterium sp. 24ML TaxID=2985512 RepID=UPI002270D08D|nr:monovalent cation/H(+) antiporter subunit G [Niveibacterium sp. 24ML]MCX9157975.1 monovalent cation/H(+) antiporter subunit G [Niveibacterium sp. 24ML]